MNNRDIKLSEQELFTLLQFCNEKETKFYSSCTYGGNFSLLGLPTHTKAGHSISYSKPVPLLDKLCQSNHFNKEDLKIFSFNNGKITDNQTDINHKLATIFANKFSVSDYNFWVFIEGSCSHSNYLTQKTEIYQFIAEHIIKHNLQSKYTESISNYYHIHSYDSRFTFMFDTWKKIVKKIPDVSTLEPPHFLSKIIHKHYLSEMEANTFLTILSYYNYNKTKNDIDYLADKFVNNARLVEKIYKIRTKNGEDIQLPQIELFQKIREQTLYHYHFSIQHNSVIQATKELKLTKDTINNLISILGGAMRDKYHIQELEQHLKWDVNGDKTEVHFSAPQEATLHSFKEDLALFQKYFLLFIKNNETKIKENSNNWQTKQDLYKTLFEDFQKYQFHDSLAGTLNETQSSKKKMKI